MHPLSTDLIALAAETAARHPLPLSVAADVAAVTALILDAGPAVHTVRAMTSAEPELPLAA